MDFRTVLRLGQAGARRGNVQIATAEPTGTLDPNVGGGLRTELSAGWSMDGTLPMGHAGASACRIANAAAGFGLSASALYAGPACPRNANAFAIEKSATEIQASNDAVIVAARAGCEEAGRGKTGYGS